MSLISDSESHLTNNELIDDEAEVSDSNVKKVKYNENEEIISEESVSGGVDASGEESEKSQQEDSNKDDENMIEIEDIIDNEDDTDKMHELLFCVQCIGKYVDEKKTVYEKNEYCEPSMRDIHRFLRKDDDENPKSKFCILKWKVIENDLIPLIINYEGNEKIQQLVLILLVDLTERLPAVMENRMIYENMLSDTHEAIVNSKLLERVAANLAESTAKLREAILMRNELKNCENENPTEEEKIKTNEIKKKIAEIENKSQQMIELILVFIMQLLNIYQSDQILKNVENNIKLIRKLNNLKVLDAIVFHSQSFDTEFGKRLLSYLLELVYFIIRIFSPKKIFDVIMNKDGNMTHLQRLREEEKQEKLARKAQYSTRSNSFGTNIKVTRPLDNTAFLVSNVSQLINNPLKVINEKMNQHANQKHKPRKNLLKNRTIGNKNGEEINFINNLKIEDNANFDLSHKDIILAIKKFCDDFLKYSFNSFVKYFNIQIIKLEQLEKYDIFYFINLMTFFLDYHRLSQHFNINEAKKTNIKLDFDAEFVKESLMPEVVDDIYK
jgi:hypothetical protein